MVSVFGARCDNGPLLTCLALRAALLQILTNAPKAGGSHLPDITCISPVFDQETKEIIFFTASRGHHADVGGILPGSMPPTSTTIFDEGAQVTSFKIVRKGVYDREGLFHHMVLVPASYPGSSGSRCFKDVEHDLQAQVAANRKGQSLIAASTSSPLRRGVAAIDP